MHGEESTRKFFIDREFRRIEVTKDNITTRFPLNPIPDDLFQTMLKNTDYGEDVVESLNNLQKSRVFEAVVCTFRPGSPFPINTAIKIIFPTPFDEIIEQQVDDIESEILSFQGRPFYDTLEERFELLRNIYLDENKIERFRFGAMEIYGGLTYKNILRDPRATLLFRWSDNTMSKSVQINTLAEIKPRGTPFFRFLNALRVIFSQKFLDLLEESHFCAYSFWICESLSKDLAPRTGFPKL